MPPEAPPEPWLSFLREVDAVLPHCFPLHCMGGFVVTLRYDFSRPTSDIDVLNLTALSEPVRTLRELGGKDSPLQKKYGVYLDVVGIVQVPENYEERLTEMFPGIFSRLKLFALDPYDLALSKLERNIQRDRDDVRHLARTVPLNPQILIERYQKELRPYLGRPEREDLTLKLWLEMIQEDRGAKS